MADARVDARDAGVPAAVAVADRADQPDRGSVAGDDRAAGVALAGVLARAARADAQLRGVVDRAVLAVAVAVRAPGEADEAQLVADVAALLRRAPADDHHAAAGRGEPVVGRVGDRHRRPDGRPRELQQRDVV